MPDTHFSSGPYKTQDIIRTIHISYQPYMPFTQTYSMGLRENSTDPLKANYFRIGPPDVEDTKITWLEDTPIISNSDIQNKLNDLREQEITEQENQETKKASGKQKLKDLGLDDDEINALMGV